MWMGTDTGLKVLDVRGNGLHQRQADSLFGHLNDALLLRADLEPQEVAALVGEEGEEGEDASDDDECGAGSGGDQEEDDSEGREEEEDDGEGGEEEDVKDSEEEGGGSVAEPEAEAEAGDDGEAVQVRAATPAEVGYATKIKTENAKLAHQLVELRTGTGTNRLNAEGGEPLVGHHEAPLRKMGSFWPNENGSVRSRADHRT